MSQAYFGKDSATRKWYALTEMPRVVQWGQTAEEAQANLVKYLENHHGLTVENWRPFPKPGEGECRDEREKIDSKNSE